MDVGAMDAGLVDSLQCTKVQLGNLLQTLRGPFAASIKNLQIAFVAYFNGNTANGEFNENIYTHLATMSGEKTAELRHLVQEKDSIQNRIIALVLKWRRDQALVANGAQLPNTLDDIKACIQQLFDVFDCLLECANVLARIETNEQSELEAVRTHLQRSRINFMPYTFIVSKEPLQVMKTNTSFSVEVQWLIGPHLQIDSRHKLPRVTCLILSEEQVREYVANPNNYDAQGVFSIPKSSGDLGNNTVNMEYNNETGVYIAKFSSMKLNGIRRAQRVGDATVVDEKFSLLFFTSVEMNGYRICVWTFSLPVVVIVHGNQDQNAWATITWDNAFANTVREPFRVPDKVTWSQCSAALNTKFASALGRPMTEENLRFLYKKLNLSPNLEPGYIKWTQMCKSELPEGNFTFWQWFFGIMKLIKDHLLEEWQAGWITGFISKNETKSILANMPVGTFLLRFSESSQYAISISFVDATNNVCMVQPWSAAELKFLSFENRIREMNELKYLYPNNALKDDAFGPFYSPRPKPNGPYLGRILVTKLVVRPITQQQPEGSISQGDDNSPGQQQSNTNEYINNSLAEQQPPVQSDPFTMDYSHPIDFNHSGRENFHGIQQPNSTDYQNTNNQLSNVNQDTNNTPLQQHQLSNIYPDHSHLSLQPGESPSPQVPKMYYGQDFDTLMATMQNAFTPLNAIASSRNFS